MADQQEAIDTFRNQFGNSDPAAQQWADGVANKIDDFAQVRQAAEQARAQSDAFVMNMAHAKDNLVQMTRDDPTTAPLALDLAPAIVNGMVGTHPGLDPSQHAGIAGPLVDHFRSEIAHAAVTSFADVDAGAAQSALDRYGDHLSDEDKGHLSGYIDTMSAARQDDHGAHVAQLAAQRGQQSDATSAAQLARLTDATGAVAFPDNWARDMMKDDRITPQNRGALYGAYNRLQGNGDALDSDPMVVRNLVARMAQGDMPTHPDVLQHVGDKLTLDDAGWLMSQKASPAQRREAQALQATLDAGRRQLAPNLTADELGAYGRFTNWLLPAYRNAVQAGGRDVLNPKSDSSIWPEEASGFWAGFRATNADQVSGASRAPPGFEPGRPTIGDIFGGKLTPPVRMPTIKDAPATGELDEGGVPMNAGGRVDG